jgi:hypothetical protein
MTTQAAHDAEALVVATDDDGPDLGAHCRIPEGARYAARRRAVSTLRAVGSAPETKRQIGP